MCLSANVPFTIEFERTGSVGVTQAPTIRLCTRPRFGTSCHTRKLVMTHMPNIPGPSKMARLRHSVLRYLLGSCIPAITSCIPNTRRVKQSVTVASASGELAYSCGRMRRTPYGDRKTPAQRDTTSHRSQRDRKLSSLGVDAHTWFCHIKSLLQKI